MWTVYDEVAVCLTSAAAIPERTQHQPVLIPTRTRDERRANHLDKLADIYLKGDSFDRGFLDEALAPGRIRCR